MRSAFSLIRRRLDRAGILLSGLCAVHCLVGVLLVSALGLGGEIVFSPAIHRIGLALALGIGAASLGVGVLRHGQIGPLVLGAIGLAMMACALLVGHGVPEAVLTVIGVGLVAYAHVRNLSSHAAH